MTAGRPRDWRGFLFVIAALVPVLAIIGAALWVLFGSVQTEGWWNTLFLQTETARSAYLTSIAIFAGGLFLYIVGVVVVGLVLQKVRRGLSSAEVSEDETKSDASAKPFRHPRARSVRDAAWIRVVEFFMEGVVPTAYGATGVWVELSKPSEERIGWVLGVFAVMVVGGLIGIFGRFLPGD